ncbi:2-succinyl-5-enolpyruvyl-6-hydroxy-3-cyclohexene-1-carboxylate synthase [Halosegnis marinus]|uniref:2-succinyl-5-enolpyruvyl-6-hydroxy-3- cyclohexene-1-carboxylate synthase n=1 Tax=Halosegnis marinus TaxID=3034023 RepID=UPI003614D36E
MATATATNPGPVHLNVPFRKPLEPTVETDDVPEGWADDHALAARGRDGPFVRTTQGRPTLTASDRAAVVRALNGADRGLIFCGPADRPTPDRDALLGLAKATGFPVLADPLSGIRFGDHTEEVTVLGGYDAWAPALRTRLPTPDVVLRFGASPTSKRTRKALADTTLSMEADAPRQFLVDPAGGWREAEFTATDTLVADPTHLASALAGRVERDGDGFADLLADVEADYRSLVAAEDRFFEGQVLADAAALAPDPATLFVSNSMPVRDLDRFAEPRAADITALGNRGASGIDGITSTALGAGSATDDPLVLVTGDLAYYHDTNGLLAVGRFGLDATIVLINNDGGGIFHLLPIEAHDTFEGYFRTPHGLDFSPTGDLYGLAFARTTTREGFREAYTASVEREERRSSRSGSTRRRATPCARSSRSASRRNSTLPSEREQVRARDDERDPAERPRDDARHREQADSRERQRRGRDGRQRAEDEHTGLGHRERVRDEQEGDDGGRDPDTERERREHRHAEQHRVAEEHRDGEQAPLDREPDRRLGARRDAVARPVRRGRPARPPRPARRGRRRAVPRRLRFGGAPPGVVTAAGPRVRPLSGRTSGTGVLAATAVPAP